MTFSEAFYGTYKIDKKDGKPHLKERIFAPVDGFWSGVMIFGGVVGTIILLLTFAAHVQVALGTFAHPAENGALTPDAQYTLWGVLVAFIFAFFVLAIPRWFLCRGTMQFSFIGAFLILLAAQLISAFSLNNTDTRCRQCAVGHRNGPSARAPHHLRRVHRFGGPNRARELLHREVPYGARKVCHHINA